MRILLVDDEPRVISAVRRGLERHGYAVDVATDGNAAIEKGTANHYDAIVLDVVLPEPHGFEVCRRLRSAECWTPILLVTGNRTNLEDRVEGLDAGADDFLEKPFAFEELTARLRAIVRRGPVQRPTVLKVGDLVLDPASRVVHRGDERIDLTHREFSLLQALMRRPGEAISREELLAGVWGVTFDGSSNVVDVFIGYLRDKIDRPFGRSSVEAVRGFGYRLRVSDQGTEAE